MTSPDFFELTATATLGLAVAHAFLLKKVRALSRALASRQSCLSGIVHLLSDVEFAFTIWALICLLFFFSYDITRAREYIASRDFTEPIFVFVIMSVSASRPILDFAESALDRMARVLPFQPVVSFIVATLALGPLAGSFITEPAVMTVIALVLFENLFSRPLTGKLRYALLALLFVNVSIGGTLTPFAAPPVLMVAPLWGWDLSFMLSNFAWRAVLASVISTAWLIYRFRDELKKMNWENAERSLPKTPLFQQVFSIVLLVSVILNAHNVKMLLVCFGVLMMFSFLYGRLRIRSDLKNLRLHQALLVSLFLASLIVFGGYQRWWLEPVFTSLQTFPLYLIAIALTGVIDNAAITYLGAQVVGLTLNQKYLIVAGSVVGGGLTVIANAPNPVGYEILDSSFGEEGINPIELLRAALFPTFVSAVVFWL